MNPQGFEMDLTQAPRLWPNLPVYTEARLASPLTASRRMSNYRSDDAYPPGLKAVRVKATPSPSPPPFIPQQITMQSSENVGSHLLKKRKKPNRRKTRPSQGDTVLIDFMDPNRPDIARLVGERALNSDSGSEADVGFALARDKHKRKNRRIDLTGLARVLGNRSYEDDRVLLNPGKGSKNDDFQKHSSASLMAYNNYQANGSLSLPAAGFASHLSAASPPKIAPISEHQVENPTPRISRSHLLADDAPRSRGEFLAVPQTDAISPPGRSRCGCSMQPS